VITALIVIASLLGALLVLAHLGRYRLRTNFLPLLARNGFCETCMKLSLRGELLHPPLTLRAEAAFGLGYLLVWVLGIKDATMDAMLDEAKRHVRSGDPAFASIEVLLHPTCDRGRCACGIPRCDGHGPDEKIVMETHASPSEARPFGVPCSCPGCAKAVLTEEELEALESARLKPPPEA